MTTHKIELACDHHEGDKFAQWLNERGHDAHVGNTAGSYIDGAWTSRDPDSSDILRTLWDGYCQS